MTTKNNQINTSNSLSTSGSKISFNSAGVMGFGGQYIASNPYGGLLGGLGGAAEKSWTLTKTQFIFSVKPARIHDVMEALTEAQALVSRIELIMDDTYEGSDFNITLSCIGNHLKEIHDMITNKSLIVLSLNDTNATIRSLAKLFVSLEDEYKVVSLSYS